MKIHLDPVAKFHRDTRIPSGLLVLGPHSLVTLVTASLPGNRWREFAQWAPQGIRAHSTSCILSPTSLSFSDF